MKRLRAELWGLVAYLLMVVAGARPWRDFP